jgi:hypothetical protein
MLAALTACADDPAGPRLVASTAQRDLAFPDPGAIQVLWDDWKSVSAGGTHSCGVTAFGRVYCWGNNVSGQLGSPGGDALRPRAIDLSNTPGGNTLRFISVSAGERHTCGVTGATEGPVYCWGNNIGATPTALPLGLVFTQVSVADTEACALTPLGSAYCWTLGGSPSPELMPSPQQSLYFTSISVGFNHKCAVAKYSEKAYCWGSNGYGQLGINTDESKLQPTQVLSPTGTKSVAALEWYNVDAGRNRFTCGVQARSSVFGPQVAGAKCWGTGEHGQLGNALTISSLRPEAVFDPPGTALGVVSAGDQHACGIERSNNSHGDAWCWGDNSLGQLGDPAALAVMWVPTRVAGNRVYKQISAGRDHTCAVSQYTRADNVARATPARAVIQCWGWNGHGQLGNNLTTGSSTPVTAIHPQQ